MKLSRTTSVEEYQIIGRYEHLRETLLSQTYANHLNRPLAYWTLPTDRRLPLAFLGRSVGDLLSTPLTALSETPGIGQKKMCSFVKLLARVAATKESDLPDDSSDSQEDDAFVVDKSIPAESEELDLDRVSEATWAQWCVDVRNHGLEDTTLGRLIPSLRDMTRVIWSAPLRDYMDYSLAELRGLKTHGEKRLRAILTVFHTVHSVVGGMQAQRHLKVRMVPRLIDRVEQWVGQVLQQPGVPSNEDIFENFVNPLRQQIFVDTPEQIFHLAENRLGLAGPITSVRQVARTMGLTRARVYQLLNEINDVMMTRWPNGRHQVYELRDKFQTETLQTEDAPDLRQFLAAIELFYPGSRRGAAGPLQHAPVVAAEDSVLVEAEIPA